MTNKKWEIFHKGMKRAEWIGKEDGMVIEWSDESGLILFVFYNNPTQDEVKDISAGSRFEIAFKDIKGIGFFSVKFGNEEWGDCSFSPNLYKEKMFFNEPKEGKTYALHIMLIDASVGELIVLRSIALGKEFAEHFRLWCIESLKKNIGNYYYNRIVDEVFINHPSPVDLAEEADIRWILAHGEDEYCREKQERI